MGPLVGWCIIGGLVKFGGIDGGVLRLVIMGLGRLVVNWAWQGWVDCGGLARLVD